MLGQSPAGLRPDTAARLAGDWPSMGGIAVPAKEDDLRVIMFEQELFSGTGGEVAEDGGSEEAQAGNGERKPETKKRR